MFLGLLEKRHLQNALQHWRRFWDLQNGPHQRWRGNCWVCGQGGATQGLCGDCVRDFLPAPAGTAVARLRCQGCALHMPANTSDGLCGACLRQPQPWSRCTVLVDYAYPFSMLVGRWKFGGEAMLARHFGRWMREHTPLAEALTRADWVVPVPLADARLRERGFDQAALLARFFCASAHASRFVPDALLRLRNTPAQSTLGQRARLRNLRGAFAVNPAFAAQLQRRRVLLLDDVLTTGATLRAATSTLLAAGVVDVEVACLARTQLR